MKNAAILGAFLLASPLSGYTIPPGESYVNVDYGYEVKLPAGLTANCDDPPRPNHGFKVLSGDLTGAEVWVVANYDAQSLETLNAVVADYAERLGTGIPVANTATTVAGLPARRLTLSGRGRTEEAILALRPQPDGVGIVFTIGLACSGASCQAARAAAEQLRQSLVLRTID
jgi:hypothetical protein